MQNMTRLIPMLREFPTSLVFNACSILGFHISTTGTELRYLTPEFPPLCGEAITIQLDCSTQSPGSSSELYYEMIDRIRKSPHPLVPVIMSTKQPLYHAAAGDGMAKTMLASGAAGLVTNGAVRDIAGIRKAGLCTFAAGLTPGHGNLHWSSLGEPVNIAGMRIHTGDLLHGDEDGLAVVPSTCWKEIIEACRQVEIFEREAHLVLVRSDLTGEQKSQRVSELSKACKIKR